MKATFIFNVKIEDNDVNVNFDMQEAKNVPTKTMLAILKIFDDLGKKVKNNMEKTNNGIPEPKNDEEGEKITEDEADNREE